MNLMLIARMDCCYCEGMWKKVERGVKNSLKSKMKKMLLLNFVCCEEEVEEVDVIRILLNN